MATEELGCDRNSKSMRLDNERKLLVDEKVEVRSLEDGFLGSWHSGIVVACENGVRCIKYDHIIEENGSESLVECVGVSPIIDSVSVPVNGYSHGTRGIIRPIPPTSACEKWVLHYGLCVDAFYEEAWWEGVIFDHEDGSDERRIFFPDLGDELMISIHMLRITLDWNEAKDIWERRGSWLFLELIDEYEQERPLFVSIKQIWYDVRAKNDFQKAGDWTSPVKAALRYLVLEAIDDAYSLTVDQFFYLLDFSEDLRKCPRQKLTFDVPALDIALKHEQGFSDAVMPVNGIGEFDLDGLVFGNYDHGLGLGLNALTNSSVSSQEECWQPHDSLFSPSNKDGNYCFSSYTDSEGFPGINQKIKVSTNRNHRRWLPVGPDIVPKAECCPSAITEYALCSKKQELKSLHALITKVRKHLSYLGWTLEFVIDKELYHRRRKGMMRVRYLSPSGNVYYSLRQICLVLNESKRIIHSPAVEHEYRSLDTSPDDCFSTRLIGQSHAIEDTCNVSSPSDTVVVEPEYCPQAVRDWYKWGKPGFQNKDIHMLQKAKKHLAFLGWAFWYVYKGRKRELRYRSPRGKCYSSLRRACESCINESGILDGNASMDKQAESTELNQLMEFGESLRAPNALRELSIESLEILQSMELVGLSKGNQGIRKSQKKRKLSNASLQKEKRQKCSGALIVGGSQPTRVLRSRKRVRQMGVPKSSHFHRQTVLSWLIDNNVVLPRSKVHYCSREGQPMVEGRITHDGIKCNCCRKVFTLSGFEAHAGCANHWPAANIFLEDGRSLLECQKQILCNNGIKNFVSESCHNMKGKVHQRDNDFVCSVCHCGGELILCDQCPSSFHQDCLGLKDVPTGDWFCPLCCCRICSQGSLNQIIDDDNNSFLSCGQCKHQYHVRCLKKKGLAKLETYPKETWFCSKICEKIFMGLEKLLGKAVSVGAGLTWTLLRFKNYDGSDFGGTGVDTMAEIYCKLNVAIVVMHECFEPVREPHSSGDLVEDVIFSRGSELRRLNFQGFYTVLLERNDELVSVATIRVHGQKVAEVPLVGTRFQYRGVGMCHILMNELEKKLTEIGVEKLVLPAVPSALKTWTGSFGFKKMTDSERLELLDYMFLNFRGTIMCQKFLTKTPFLVEPREYSGSGHNIEVNDCCPSFEGFRAGKFEESEIMDRGSVDVIAGKSNCGSYEPAAPLVAKESSHPRCESGCSRAGLEPCVEDADHKLLGLNDDRHFKVYRRRKILAIGA